jgi:flagellar hook-associated protein 3 FlgL
MAFRISDNNIFQNSIRSIRDNRVDLARLQEQITSGKRLASVSEDPGGASRIFALHENLDRIAQFQKNIEGARAQLDSTETALASVTNVLIRVRELAVSADVERGEFDQIQAEVENSFQELLGLANRKVGDRFLFGGFVTDTAPISQTGAFTDPAPIVSYAGDSGAILAQIDSGAQLQLNVTARELFLGSTDADDLADGTSVNIFSLVQDLRNRLADPTTNGEPADTLGDIDRALSQVSQIRGRIGARANRIESTADQLGALRISVDRERTSIEEVDLVQAITDLQSREATLQAALSVTGRVLQPSLLSFLG